MFQRILVPVDLSEPGIADGAVAVACEMAKAASGQVRFVHVIDSALIIAPMLYLPPVDFNQFTVEQQNALAELSKKIDLPPERVSSLVRMGGVYSEVLAEAAEWKADLVIIGAHRPSMATYLLGSSAAAIVRHATCPVLVMRTQQAAKFL